MCDHAACKASVFEERLFVVLVGLVVIQRTRLGVEQVNGIDVWYVGLNTNNLKLYDYVEKGNILGEATTNTIYLYYQKDGNFIDYKEYLG